MINLRHTFGVGAVFEDIAGVSEAICMPGKVSASASFTKRF